MDHRVRRRLFSGGMVGGLLAVLSVVVAQPAWAGSDQLGPGDSGPEKIVLRKSKVVTIPLKLVKAGNGGVSPNHPDVPPLGGCTDDLFISIDAWYKAGILAQTDSYFSSNITCVSTEPDQTMKRLTLVAKLYKDTLLQKEAVPRECRHVLVTDPLCTGVFSGDVHRCFGQFNCAGNYQMIDNSAFVLPNGWGFGDEPPEGCFDFSTQERLCAFSTDVYHVPPFA